MLLLAEAVGTSRLLSTGFLYPMVQGNGHGLIIDLVLYVGFLVSIMLAQGPNGRPRARFWTSAIACTFVVVYILATQLVVRPAHPTPPPVQDGAVQTEEAAKFILHGVNPYAADFQPTRFGEFPSPYSPTAPNVSWTHYVYPPLNAVLAIPVVWLQRAGWHIDVSVEYTIALLIMAFVLAAVQRSWNRRTLVLLLFLANPFVWMLPIAGLNDTLMLLCIVLAALFMIRQRWIWAGIFFGLAIASKQYFWVISPLWAWWVWSMVKRGLMHPRYVRQLIVAAGITVAILFLPFLIANAPAVYDDLVRYLSGSIPHSYPIAGSTFVQYLKVFGFISSPWAAVPTAIFELIVGLPLFWWASRHITRHPTASTTLMAGAVVTLGVLLVSRFFLINYGMTVLCLMIIAYALDDHYAEN